MLHRRWKRSHSGGSSKPLGEALTGSTTLFMHVFDATASEALALKNGMELADQWGCSNVIFESDCLEIIQPCKREVDIPSPYSATLNECFHLAQSIGLVLYSHCPREENKVAHELARSSYDSNSVIFWEGDPPQIILAELVSDVTVI